MIISSRYAIVISALFSIILHVNAMESNKKIRVAVIAYGHKAGLTHEYTHDNLFCILAPTNFQDIEKETNKEAELAYQLPWYDKRQAALAADFLLNDVSLKNNKGENLIRFFPLLKESSLEKMAYVLALGNMMQRLQPYFKAASQNKCAEEGYIEKAILYCVAKEGLKLAYEEGKDLIDEIAYLKAVKPDEILRVKSDGSIAFWNDTCNVTVIRS